MSDKEQKQQSEGKPSIPEVTERIENQSIKDQPEGIREKSSHKSGKQSRQGKSKAFKSAQQGGNEQPAKKQQMKKKIEGAALIGIDVAKDADFSEWYQQVLTKGDFLDYYDVSGCVSPCVPVQIPQAYAVARSVHSQATLVFYLGRNTNLVQQEDKEHWRRELCFPLIRVGRGPPTGEGSY